MYCPNCGSPLQPHQNFCGTCGTQLLHTPPPPMNMPVTSLPFWDNFVLCMTKKYFTFSGRASRGEYWRFQLMMLIILFGILLLGGLLFVMTLASMKHSRSGDAASAIMMVYAIIIFIICMYIYIPSLAVEVRRFHDAGYSAWWVLLGFIPYVGPFAVMIVCGVLEPQPFPNEYGPIPDSTEELKRINEKKAALKKQ